jgi:hypothetical protein
VLGIPTSRSSADEYSVINLLFQIKLNTERRTYRLSRRKFTAHEQTKQDKSNAEEITIHAHGNTDGGDVPQ